MRPNLKKNKKTAATKNNNNCFCISEKQVTHMLDSNCVAAKAIEFLAIPVLSKSEF